MHSAQNFGATVFVTTQFLEKSSIRVGFWPSWSGHRFCFLLHAVAIVFVYMHAVPYIFLHAVAIENGPRDINKEIVAKMVPVRTADLSIGPF